MPINADKPQLWKSDVERSIDFYNDWFIRFAPETYRIQRGITTAAVLDAFNKTSNLTRILPDVLRKTPGLLQILRMVTAPPLARDRLMGLAHVGKSLIDALEGKEKVPPRLPQRMSNNELQENFQKLCDVLAELIDDDLIPWIASGEKPSKQELDRAATVIADRMCGASSDPIIRNAQERRQLATLGRWLRRNGYKAIGTQQARDPYKMPPGTFTFRLSLPAGSPKKTVKIPIDCVIKPLTAKPTDLPILIEAKSAGDATNTNKRRKEEAQKFRQLKERYGNSVKFLLFLCGYFEPGYLGYEAAEGIDWVWEHRMSDFHSLLVPDHKKKVETTKESPGSYTVAESQTQEESRAVTQEEIDSRKTTEDRNKLGQFSTPFPLACQIVARAIRSLPAELPICFLEPAAGTGVFFSALLRTAKDKSVQSAVGCEIDPAYGDVARSLWEPFGFKLIGSDFMDFACDPVNFGKFTLLCTNPPYVRHHHLQFDQKLRLQSLVKQRLGLQPSGLSGLYVYFVLMADALLVEGAVASWLLPAEFLYVNYGRVIRDYLTSRVTVLSIHHFDPDDVQFDDALVSSCIVTYCKKAPSSDSMCEVSYGGDYIDPKQKKSIAFSRLRGLTKWTMFHFEPSEDFTSSVRLKDFVSVRRGIATGANDFFMIDEDTAKRFKIPRIYLKPILPSPRFIHGSVIESNPDGTPQVDGFRYLIDCPLPPDDVKRLHPGLWTYLQEGVAKGLPDRYLCAQREVWYFQEKREPALFLASYMGRANDNRPCPIRFFVNFSQAIVANVFLNLYPTPELQAALNGDRERMIEFVNTLNSLPPDSVLQAGRSYGGGLHKIEPKELLEVQLDVLPAWLEAGLNKQLVLI
jgi:predicted RNA methylase